MPIYKYRCTECHKVHEVMQKMTDDPLKQCAECGGEVKKMIGRVGIKFNGSGFYVTDRKGSKTLTSESSQKTEAKADKKTETPKEGEAKAEKPATTGPTEKTPESQPIKKEAV